MEQSSVTNGNGITRDIVAKLWNLCNVLRDDGITYTDYLLRNYYVFTHIFRKQLLARKVIGPVRTHTRFIKLSFPS
jgi:hypothetical protein